MQRCMSRSTAAQESGAGPHRIGSMAMTDADYKEETLVPRAEMKQQYDDVVDGDYKEV